MSGDGAPAGGGCTEPVEVEQERRRLARERLEAIFGDVLPEQTRDDRADTADRPSGAGDDERIWREVPPHHG